MFKKLQDYMMSYSGKVLINFLYAWGAAIAILGTLFKLLHLEYANLMLCVGLGTEVFIFFISGFDLPAKPRREAEEEIDMGDGVPVGMAVGGGASGVVYVGGGTAAADSAVQCDEPTGAVQNGNGSSAVQNGNTGNGGSGVQIIGGMGASIPELPNIPAEELEEATTNYLDQLKEMTETIGRINAGLQTFTTDPTQMESVNRHIAGLNAIFELQLRSASKQVDSVDKVREQTDKMAKQIEELNQVYDRMLKAMTTNMNLPYPNP